MRWEVGPIFLSLIFLSATFLSYPPPHGGKISSMWAILRNSIEAGAATLIGAIVAYLFVPITTDRGLVRAAEEQAEVVLLGSVFGAAAYFGWRAITKTL